MFARILKDSEASILAWRSRHRAAGRTGSKGSRTGLLEHYAERNDPNASVAKTLSGFTKAEKSEIMLNIERASSAKTSMEHYAPNGVFSEERMKLHEKIINEILSDENIKAATPGPGESPTYILLGGRGGSGKSSFTDGTVKEFDSSKFLKLDSDAIKEKLRPPYEGWNAFSVHAESSHLFDSITAEAHKMGLNILHDSTLRSDSIGSTVAQMKASGYKVEGHYMFLPRQDAAVRAVQRFLSKGPGKRGRLVPPEVVLANTTNEENFERLSKYFDKWSAYDNSGAKGTTPKLIKRGAKKS